MKAYAKINLFLDIQSTLPNGYHAVDMVMQSISLHDEITVDFCPEIKLTANTDAIPMDERNLCYRAARAFFEAAGIEHEGVKIHMEKHIPVEAGLAGGSADAAAVLHSMNALFDARLSLDTLCQIGVSLGADVPFCLTGGTQLAEGIGEVLTPLLGIPNCHLVLCKPPIGICTKDAYELFDQKELEDRPLITSMLQAIKQNDLPAVGSSLYNVFEDLLEMPEVRSIREVMRRHGTMGAQMSGSGPTVFGIFEKLPAAQECCNELRRTYGDVFLCHPVRKKCFGE